MDEKTKEAAASQAAQPAAKPAGKNGPWKGKVVTSNATGVTVLREDGTKATHAFGPKGKVKLNDKDSTLAALAADDEVVLEGHPVVTSIVATRA